jgi:hypothetical protein
MRRSALVPKDMRELVRLYTQIALLRRGPQDLPASALLLALTIIAYLAINLLMNGLAPPPGPSNKATDAEVHSFPAQLLLDTAFTLVWYVVLLRLARRPERTLQTSTAVFGFQIVLTPLLFSASWLWLRFSPDQAWAVPAELFEMIVVVWIIAANSLIVKSALEWSGAASVALVILQFLASVLLSHAVFFAPKG